MQLWARFPLGNDDRGEPCFAEIYTSHTLSPAEQAYLCEELIEFCQFKLRRMARLREFEAAAALAAALVSLGVAARASISGHDRRLEGRPC